MQTLFEGLVGLIFATWFICSIVGQFPRFRWYRCIRKYDYFSLVPLWTFFAPNPGRSDYRLVYREKRADGTVSEWREIPVIEPRKPHSFIWNPEKRSKKVLGDIVSSCAMSVPVERRFDARPVMLTLSYLIVLSAVCHHAPTTGVTQRQFLIVETFGFRRSATPNILLCSEFHPISPVNAVRAA